MEVLSSGKTTFKIEVPYKLFHTGERKEKPLIVYLHGYNQNIEMFEKQTKAFHKLDAHHLYIQGPYAAIGHVKHRAKWGFAWYLYNGKQGAFLKNLEYTSEFIQGVIDHLLQYIKVSRLCVIGYSMGGYQAGHFAFSRWKHTNELIVIGGRIKTESLKSKFKYGKHINTLALHGTEDDQVSAESQQKSISDLQANKINAEMKTWKTGHKMTSGMQEYALNWLKKAGY